ncbi:MAG TPA: bifunctional homocysteine S-methyltransferase/methylenetetrahydrofolate reductase [Candidatus Kapabacteria bacterium]|nr:bifunctional homocysteine S-methyltransferase/methylenetetrahydrofolate reductase [Candidatus Kapabacteria bacterium]
MKETLKERFLDRLQRGVIVCDGPLDAALLQRNLKDTPVDLYNLTQPVIIEQLHREFVDAGAEIIQSNTMHANRIVLSRHKMDDKVYEINRKGVWLARTAAVHRAYVAGVVGPTRRFLAPIGKITADEVRDAFSEQISALIDGGADAIFLKSFIDLEELMIAIEALRALDPDIPLVAHKTFPEDGAVLASSYPTKVAKRLAESGVNCYGSDGTVGPQRMLGFIQSLWRENVILSAQPDVSIPVLLDGRPIYTATKEYVAESARALVSNGVTIIGASGGVTPEIVQTIAEAVKGMNVKPPEIKVKKKRAPEPAADPGDRRSEFAKKIAAGKFVTTVELDIPRGLDLSSVIEGAKYLKEKDIDAVNITDGARARLRMGSIAISHEIIRQTGMECMTHIACRDRNMVALQSDLLSAWTLGIKNILVITGDPTHIGDFPYATSVYDVDAIGLIRAVRLMNLGEDLVGNPIGEQTAFSISCAANPLADDFEREMDRLTQKAEQGAQVIFTQPVFEIKPLERFIERTKKLNIPVVLGIIPLRSYKHAEFLHHEVPGITIPETIQHRLLHAGEQANAEGVKIAIEFIKEAKKMVKGLYLLPPFKKYDMAVEVLEKAL